MTPIEWYFDFVSPFAYLQLEVLARRAPTIELTPVPIVLGAILSARGQLGPAEIPAKRRFTYRFVQWQAAREGIALRFPPTHPFNPIRALRLAIVAGGGVDAVRLIFRHLWRDGRSLDDPGDWSALSAAVGVEDTTARISNPEVKNALRQNGERALAAGVFGVPTIAIDGQLFWGADATAMALDFLRDPTIFSSGEYARLDGLPIGAARERP